MFICWFVKCSWRNFWFSKLSVVHVIMLTFNFFIRIWIAITECGSEPFNTRTDWTLSLFRRPESWKNNTEKTFSPTKSYDKWFIYMISLSNNMFSLELWFCIKCPKELSTMFCIPLLPETWFDKFVESFETSIIARTCSTW